MGMGAHTVTNTGPRRMLTDARLLTLTQWLSPAYPLGSFAYSHGLEAACAQGRVSDAASLEAWLRDVVTAGSGHMDAIWIARAHGGEEPLALNALATSWMASSERIREAERQGAAFVQVTSEVWGLDLPPLVMPVALGRAARLMDLPLTPVITLYLQSFTGNLVAAAQRLMPLGQTAAQGVWARLGETCLEVAAGDLEDLWSNAFLSDISAMNHEVMTARMFQT